jgi:hypothetical protein
MCMSVTIDEGFGLITGFTGHFNTQHLTEQITVTQN